MTIRPALLVLVLLSVLAGAAQTAPPRAAGPGARAGASNRSSRPAAPAVSFEEASRRAAAARDGGDSAEAIRWYREGVRQRPSWQEGWWYVGALSYERHESAQAVRAFSRFVALKPDSGPGWALRGLAEFEAARYAASLQHLTKGLSLGTVGNAEIRDAVYLRLALLRIRGGQFELAVQPLSALAQSQPEGPLLVTACGLLLLRRAQLPSEVPGSDRELVETAGRAGYAAMGRKPDARQRFEHAIRRFPQMPGLHYGYGGYLRGEGPSETAAAIEEFRKEIALDPKSVYPRLEIAFELMRTGEHAAAVPYAQEAVGLAPDLFAAHHALGRALLETGQLGPAIAEFEVAVRLAPESPEMHATLARAYVQAGRREDAERQNVIYRRLQQVQKATTVPGYLREGASPGEPKP